MARKAKEDSNKKEWTGMPTIEAEAKELKAMIESTYEEYVALEAAKGQLKDIFDEAHAKFGIPKRLFNFLAKSNYTGNGYEDIQKNTELKEAFEAYESIAL